MITIALTAATVGAFLGAFVVWEWRQRDLDAAYMEVEELREQLHHHWRHDHRADHHRGEQA